MNAPGEEPEPQSVRVEVQQVGHPSDEGLGFGVQALLASEHVLKGVIGGIADMGLRVDDEPWLAPGGEHIAGVEIGAEDDLSLAGRRKTPEKADTFPGEALVEHAAAVARHLLDDPATDGTLVHLDLHAGNVLAGEREPWLVIDPKAVSGDPHAEPAPVLWN